ncbi:MAG: hypothetical protein LBD48_04780 [Treponema sp.]|jgi:hypothetical protein|nr:hypothetical protein [Treponema sp.]
MIQFYFLSIIFNGLSGFLLIMGENTNGFSIESSMKFSPASSTFRLVLGFLTGATGILKLLSPSEKPLILGDLIPALAGIAAGFILIFGFYREHASSGGLENGGSLDRLGDAFLRYRKLAGAGLLAVALLHFLFPTVLFL